MQNDAFWLCLPAFGQSPSSTLNTISLDKRSFGRITQCVFNPEGCVLYHFGSKTLIPFIPFHGGGELATTYRPINHLDEVRPPSGIIIGKLKQIKTKTRRKIQRNLGLSFLFFLLLFFLFFHRKLRFWSIFLKFSEKCCSLGKSRKNLMKI